MGASSSPDSRGVRGRGRRSAKREGGFTLVEVLISMLVLTIGLIATAGLLAVTTTQQIAARESARSIRLANDKIDELMKLPFTSPAISVGGDLNTDVDDYHDSPADGIDLRWAVTAGPTDGTRVLTVRVLNRRAQQSRQTQLVTIVREW